MDGYAHRCSPSHFERTPAPYVFHPHADGDRCHRDALPDRPIPAADRAPDPNAHVRA